MNVLVYAPLAVLGHHFETDLEIIQNHLNDGDHVTVVTCDGELKSLDFMACKGGFRCAYCKSRRSHGLKQLINYERLEIINLQKLIPVKFNIPLAKLRTIELVKTITYKNVEIGAAFASSLISDLRDPAPDISKQSNSISHKLYLLASLTDQMERVIENKVPDLVYFFNGRFTLYRSIMRVCQIRKIPFYVHERGANNKRYSLTKNTLPHDILEKHAEILNYWQTDSIPIDEKIRSSAGWYESNAVGKSTSWRSFTDQHDIGSLPSSWNNKNHNVSLFVSSDDEMAAVPGWEIELFQSQYEATRFILQAFAHDASYKFYVRIHPNLRGLRNKDIQRILSVGDGFENCTVIPPESKISTYALLKNSNKILTFGSTTGVEATYWGTPSILIGKSFYMHLNAAYQPSNKEDVLKFIEDKDLLPKPKEEALKYGYWAASIGMPFKHYKPLTLSTGHFNGVYIGNNSAIRYLNYFFVLLLDIKKILKGEYGFWHLVGKIKSKLPGTRLVKG